MEGRAFSGLKGRIAALLVAAALVGFATASRVWLASTGGYSAGGAAAFMRVASGVALLLGFLLAGLALAWPMKGNRPPGDKADVLPPSRGEE